jgi:hypothetical protein
LVYMAGAIRESGELFRLKLGLKLGFYKELGKK